MRRGGTPTFATGLWRWAILLSCAAATLADEALTLEQENEQLQQRLAALQGALKEEEQYSYVVSKGMIAGAENVFMETMELTDAKNWCNSNAQCKGFTFLAPAEGESQPEGTDSNAENRRAQSAGVPGC